MEVKRHDFITAFERNLAQTWKILLIILAAMTMYTTVIIYMYDPELAHMLNDVTSRRCRG